MQNNQVGCTVKLAIRYNLLAMQHISRLVVLILLVLCTGCYGNPISSETDFASGNTPIHATDTATLSTIQITPGGATAITPSMTVGAVTTTPELPLTTPINTIKATLSSQAWTTQPVVPAISPRVKEIYLRGLELGNNPHAFSKVGDCGSTPSWFLGDFDRGTRYYQLGEYQSLEEVIQEFRGSFARTSLSAKSGFNASSVFAPLWADRKQCLPDEFPLACEYRVHRPSFAFITLGTNDVWHMDTFEPQMRRIIEFSIENGVVPILSTKADNDEGDGSINAMIASLAQEYEVPLWNYWLAVQPLPEHGLQEDGAHISWGANRFDDPQAMQKGWPMRNLTALQVLDTVWRTATDSPGSK